MHLKRFILITLTFVLTFSSSVCASAITIDGKEYEYNNKHELIEKSNEQQNRMNLAHDMALSARSLGYPESHDVIKLAKEEYGKAEQTKQEYEQAYEQIVASFWTEKENQYYNATYIWRKLKNAGFNDYVCAGILGNIMTEVGGQTLDIQHQKANKYYTGMCQWSKTYTAVWGASLDVQCNYLINTLEYEINTYGYAYKRGFSYNKFLNLTNEKEVAKAFAVCYERCKSSTYKIRQRNATAALNFFSS